ncbi:ferredoxin [Leucobacter sp. M11]|uniref:ferredoxin n=1 Tax=Leucobacter sp. M11 TaxID=2993565 RepID=UPI002D7E9DBE|nr:ferredoxin [Leucobacter sp. M11]MEB4616493.1 ferredoxin [Leucobacter sp. M11]
MNDNTRVVSVPGRCQGYASCVITDPDRFDLGPDGRVLILKPVIQAGELGLAEEAIRACPAAALKKELETS